ncbi:MAG TPA: hypothetical protein VGL81_13655 [Polyangiaceae bacterium]
MEDVAGPLEGPLAEALARGRAAYNARAAAAKLSPTGDVPALMATLRRLDPIVRAAHARDPAVVDTVVSALFDAALELVPRGFLGPGARSPELEAAWRALLAGSGRMLCADPRRVVAATMNALTTLADCRGARPADWVETMARLSERAGDVEVWLKAGVVAAWRSGLAHARTGALDACARLPAELGAVAMGLDPSTDVGTMARVVERLRRDPWAWPPHVASARQPPLGVKLVAYVGGFRGFGAGGVFIAPPTVGLRDGVFIVTDGERVFELHADFFGATLLPIGPASPGFEPPPGRGAMVLADGGEVRHGEDRRAFPGLVSVTSWASTDLTLVATRPISHRLALVARSGYGL